MLTIKSDDVAGRAKAFEAIVKGTEIPQALVPESFRVLVKELQALGMGVQTLGAKIIQLPEVQVKDELKEEIEEMKRVLQAETSSDVSEIEGVESSPFEIIDAGPQTEEIKGGEEE